MNIHSKPTASAPYPQPFGHAGGAIVLGGAHGSLAVVRSLGRHGIQVWFVTHDHPIAGWSRYAKRRFSWPGPNGANAIHYLLEFINSHQLKGWVLIAGGDAEARLISKHHAELSKVVRVTPAPWQITQFADNKNLTYERAEALGIGYPRCFHPKDRAELVELECRFPIVLKPSSHNQINAFTLAKAWKAENRAELISLYDQALGLVGREGIVLQEFIPGTGESQFSYAAVWKQGRPLASLIARRVRQYPVEFGYTSTFVETVENVDVDGLATKFLRSLNYSGVVELEFKFDARDRRYKLLDFNARIWTWIALGSIAGADFPYVLWCAEDTAVDSLISHNRMEDSPIRGRAGAAWMHLARDLVAAAQLILRGTLTPFAYFRSMRRPVVFSAFAIDDPLPGFLELPLTFSRVLFRGIAWLGPQKRVAAGQAPINSEADQGLPKVTEFH